MTYARAARRRDLAAHRRHAAVHEGGHAAASYLLGMVPYSLQLPAASGQPMVDSRGRSVRAGGFCEGGITYNPGAALGRPPTYTIDFGDPEILTNARVEGLAAAAVCLAGSLAEARYRRQSFPFIMLNWGREDLDQVAAIAADLWPDRTAASWLEITAQGIVVELFRGQMPAIYALAEELAQAGRLDCEQLHALMPDLFGPRPKGTYFDKLRPILVEQGMDPGHTP